MVSSRSWLLPAAVLLGSLEHAVAQTSSSCNPVTNTSACPVDAAFGTDYLWTFNTSDAPSTKEWTVTAGTVDWTSDGANFTIKEKGDSPTIRTEFYIFGGRVEIWMKAAPGQGIISSVMLLSDDLDEIDLEFLGGNGTAVQTNFFGKGVNNYTWESDFEVSGGTINDFHNYTIDWTNSSLNWYIDGELKRHLTPEEANNTHSYPQTPMRLYIGPWAGGDPDNAEGTIQWAGGETDYSAGPYTMGLKSVRVTDYGRGTAYNYTDNSGTWDSIQMLNTDKNSTAADSVNAAPSETISQKWNKLSSGTKSAVYACSAAAVAGLAASALWFCWRQRRRGMQEAQLAAQRQESERLEMEGYKAAGIDPDGFAEATPEYDARTGMATRDVLVNADTGYSAEKYGAMSMEGAMTGAGAQAASRPLLRERGMSNGSPPGTPQGHMGSDPYSDGFSPIDHNGFGNVHPQSPPSGPLPAVPGQGVNRSFSSPMAQMHPEGFEQPQRSFSSNAGPGQQGQYWR